MQTDNEVYKWLFEWSEPERLSQMVDTERLRLGAEAFLISRNAKVLREAMIVGKVGSLIGVRFALMSDRDPPDALFKLYNGREVPVEITELLQAGRRRGNEEFSGIRHQSHDELAKALNYNDAWLDEAVNRKLKKDATYPPGTVVIIYHNTSLYHWDSAREQIKSELERAASRSGVNIIGSIILFSGKVYGEATIRSLQA